MIGNFQILTVTHQTLDVNDIAQFILQDSDPSVQSSQLQKIKTLFNIDEICYLQTCNRVCYLIHRENDFAEEEIAEFFKLVNPSLSDKTIDQIHKFVNLYSGESAIQHILTVTSSLDSLVVGEREIFRQYRNAYTFAKENNLCGDNLRLLDIVIVAAAKEVYSKTKIGEKSLSVVALAIEELMKSNPSNDAKIIMVGAGDTNALVGKFLLKKGFSDITIFNRSLDNASKLCNNIGAKARHLSELSTYTEGFDILIACTGATQAVINEENYTSLLQRDVDQKLLVDLSVPRNICAKVVQHNKVHYINIEKLRDLAQENLSFRKKEVVVASNLLKKHIANFLKLYQTRQIEKAMIKIPKEIKAIKEKAVNQLFKDQIDTLDEDSKVVLMNVLNYMEKNAISVPMKLAKQI